jgi:hypothetical protein
MLKPQKTYTTNKQIKIEGKDYVDAVVLSGKLKTIYAMNVVRVRQLARQGTIPYKRLSYAPKKYWFNVDAVIAALFPNGKQTKLTMAGGGGALGYPQITMLKGSYTINGKSYPVSGKKEIDELAGL